MQTAELAQQRKAGEQAAERQQQTNLAAMEIQSRRELAQFEAQMRIQAIKLSQAWEVEKMQRESELDFQFEQKKLTLSRDAFLQKQTIAKEQFLAYSDAINNDKTLSPEERTTSIRMARDKIQFGVDLSEEVYFKELRNNASPFADMTTQPGGAGTTPAAIGTAAPVTAEGEVVSAMRQVNAQSPGASLETVEAQAAPIARKALIDRFTSEISAASGGQMSEDAVVAQATKRADTELQVQQGYIKSKRLGYTPTPYQEWETLIKSIPGVQKAKTMRHTLTPSYMTAVLRQQAADKARAAVKLYKKSPLHIDYVPASKRADVSKKAGILGIYRED